jgi:hypothetical protein
VALKIARTALGRIFFQRCFYLFVALLVLITVVPFLEDTQRGRIAVNLANLFIVVAAVAAVGRSPVSFLIAVLLAAPTAGFQLLGLSTGEPRQLALSWSFAAALYGATITYLLSYVLRRDVMTADKLWGAAAVFMMIGVLWAYLYAIAQHLYPGSFAIGGTTAPLSLVELLYFSFTVLTSTGFGDIAPATPQARAICVLQQIFGILFVAILIARLAGVYPPLDREARPAEHTVERPPGGSA